jgi:hypothetical protein
VDHSGPSEILIAALINLCGRYCFYAQAGDSTVYVAYYTILHDGDMSCNWSTTSSTFYMSIGTYQALHLCPTERGH